VSVLEPRVKTKLIKANCTDADVIIRWIKTFLKSTYYHDIQLPEQPVDDEYKSFEYKFLKQFQTDATTSEVSDIDQYLNKSCPTFN
jgi:hypothetical protein